MARNTESDELIRHVKKKLYVTLHGLRPTSLSGRLHGPRVLLNSMPKSGTNLLEHTLMRFPILRSAGKKTLAAPKQLDLRVLEAIKKISRGQYFVSHLPYYEELEEVIEENNIRALLMIRDPRDIVVSAFRYVLSIHRAHRASDYISSLPDDDARLSATIRGVPGVFEPIARVLERYRPWLDCANCKTCRYEDLVGSKGGGSDQAQSELVTSIGEFLEIPLDTEDVHLIANGIYSTRSATFNKGKISAWRETFAEQHKRLFKQLAGESLIAYGYEADNAW